MSDGWDIDRICRALDGESAIAQWTVREQRTLRGERYRTFDHDEVLREVHLRAWECWIATEARDGRQGEARFRIERGDGTAAVAQRLAEALDRAAAADGPAWTLPGPEDDAAARDCHAPADYPGERLGDHIDGIMRQWVDAAATLPAAQAASCCEVLVTRSWEHLRNHRGLDLSQERWRSYVEFVLLHRGADASERELYDSYTAGHPDGVDLTARVQRISAALEAGASAAAPTAGPVTVLLKEPYLGELLDWVAHHADAAVHARGIQRLQVGQALAVGSRLDLFSDPGISSEAAYAFDPDGYRGQRVQLVRDGQLSALHGLGKWQQALGRQPTGALGTVVVPPGERAVDELREAGVLEIERLSEFHPRTDSGAFSGEIRLAWMHEADGTRRPVSGGSIAGLLQDSLGGLVFSRETADYGSWSGPAAALVPAVRLVT